MIYYITLAFFILLLLGGIIFIKDRTAENVAFIYVFVIILIGLFFIGLTIYSIGAYDTKIGITSQLETFEQKEKILTEKSNSTLELLKIEVERYYEYELEIFKDIRPDNVNILLIKYPELKTSGLVMGYMEQIVKLNNDIYDLRFNRTDYEAKLNYYKQNQLIF